MKKTLMIILILFNTSVLFQNCKRDSSCEYTQTTQINYDLKETNKSRIPYTGFDTISFINDLGDTATLYGKGKSNYYITHTSGLSNADCGFPQFKYNYENIDYIFSGINTNFNNLRFSAYMYDKIASPQLNSIIIVCDFLIENSSFEDIDDDTQIKDSVIINGQIKYGVYLNPNIDKFILFNLDIGILKITFNGRTWTKLK